MFMLHTIFCSCELKLENIFSNLFYSILSLQASTLMLWAALFPNLILLAIILKKVDFCWADPKLK